MVVVSLVWGWPTGPRVTDAGWGIIDDAGTEALSLSLAMCEGNLIGVDVDEDTEAVNLTVRATGLPRPWEDRAACARIAVVQLDWPPGDRRILDRSGWFRIPREVEWYDLG